MRARLLVNPTSGTNRGPQLLPAVNERLRSFVDELDITLTCDAADVERGTVRALNERCDALFVAGGDGTLNLALRALIDSGTETFPAIGVIPFGTGNDFVKALGLGEDPLEAVEQITDQRIRRADIGLVNGRPFANVSAGGFIADVSHVLTEELKDAAGKAAFLLGGARVLWSSEPFSAEVTVPGASAATRVWTGRHSLRMFAVCNARQMGGGYPVAPAACLDDGLLDVFLVKAMGVLEFVGVLQRFAAGTHVEDERVGQFRTSTLRLAFDRPVRVNTDGEPFESETCDYEVRRRYMPFYVGRTAPCFGDGL
jgi:YegS/Rv2252/BmrU family lipid kinase